MASLKRNFVYSSILTTANCIFPLITYPYVSRVLGVAHIGICNWVDSIINYAMLFSMMGITVVGNREIARSKGDPARLNVVFSNLFALNALFTAGTLLVLLAAVFVVPQFHAHKELILIGAVKIVSNFLLVEWFFRGMEDFKYITKRSIIVRCIYVLSVFLLVRDRDDYTVYFLLISLMFAGNALINMAYSRRFVRISFRNIRLKEYVKPFLSYGYYFLLTSAYTSFNVLFLGFVTNDTQVGYFTTATKLYLIILSFFTALTGVVLPRASSLVSEGRTEEFRAILDKSVQALCALGIPCVIAGILLSGSIVSVLSGQGYEGAVTPMRITMPLILIVGYEQIIIIQGLIPYKKDKAVITATTVGAIVGVVLNILLLPILQSVGAAVVWVVSETVILICAQHFSAKYLRIRFPLRRCVQYVLSYIPFAGIVLWILSWQLPPIFTLLVSGTLLLVYIYLLQRFFFREPVIMNLYSSTFSWLALKKRT